MLFPQFSPLLLASQMPKMSIALLQLIFAYIFLPTFAWGQTQNLTFIEGFVNSLTNLCFGDFGQVLLQINETAVGQNIIAALPNGNVTVFVPSNQACEFSYLRSFLLRYLG